MSAQIFYDSWRLVPFLIIGAVFLFGSLGQYSSFEKQCVHDHDYNCRVYKYIELHFNTKDRLIAASYLRISYIVIGVIRMFFSRRYLGLISTFVLVLTFSFNSMYLIRF